VLIKQIGGVLEVLIDGSRVYDKPNSGAIKQIKPLFEEYFKPESYHALPT
jgi:hypothetical protein